MRKTAFLILLTMYSTIAGAQGLPGSRQSSFFTYIYRLTDTEAKQIYKNERWKVDGKFFHSLIDSFPTGSQYDKFLPRGHYLKAYARKNRLDLEIATVSSFDVMILRNNSDLAVRVYDLKGEIISTARVTEGIKSIGFDRKTESYTDRKSNRKGLLTVTHDGFSAYFNLSRQHNNSVVRRTARQVAYGSPVKYVWRPVRFVINLPVDGVKSISDGYPRGTIQRTGRFFTTSFYRIACIFDDYYCDYYTSPTRQTYKGYLVFNKPKYMPRDTVRFKAYITGKNGRPLNEDIEATLTGIKKNIILASISPYRKGACSFDFYLHDSLDLQLDQNYTIILKDRRERHIISGSFRYEDYELRSIRLDLEVDTAEHFYGRQAVVKAKGTNENDLNVFDGRLQVLVKPGQVEKYFGDYVFVADTLSYWEMNLEREYETKIIIPDSIFPKANLTYDVSVTMLTSSNESISETISLNYYYLKEEIEWETGTDSLLFFFRKNGCNIQTASKIHGIDNFGNRTQISDAPLPVKLGINPYYSEYLVETDSLKTSFSLAAENSLIQCFSERSKDSIRLIIRNPRKLPFTYFIYRRNTEKDRGYTDSLSFNIAAATKENYFVSIQYLWGGKLKDENFKIPYDDRHLKITVTEPKLVYPSQQETIELLVTDQENKPVAGADVTAYSLTGKFEYSPPAVPTLGKQRKNKNVINNFSLNDPLSGNHRDILLDYRNWRLLAGLDSIEYYKFIYPGNEIYKHHYPAETTQFAPFVVSNGAIQPVHVIYLDSKPVYFSWSTSAQPYSFKTDSGYHTVRLRTSHRTYQVDSVLFYPKMKTVFSIRDSIINKNVRITREENQLSNYEKNLLYRYIFPYRYQFGEYFGYLEQNGRVYFLNPGNTRSGNLAGPVDPSSLKFHLIDNFSTGFVHEPFFEYEFSPQLLKMRNIDTKTRYPGYLLNHNPEESLSDRVLNSADIEKNWKNYLESRRHLTARYNWPKTTSSSKGRLQADLKSDDDIMPLNILLFRYDNPEFLRIYPGKDLVFHDLAGGYYKLLFFFPGSEYSVIDSLYVKPDGMNIHTIKSPERFTRDTFSIRVSRIIEENIFRTEPVTMKQQTELFQINRVFRQSFGYTGEGDIIEGYVYDDTGEAIPGGSVSVKGTTFGTLTNIDGYYSLKVPKGRHELQFSFIGYQGQEVDITGKNGLNVYLTPDVLRLEEVVVVGYGVQKKHNLTGAISVSSLAGKVAGIEISGQEIQVRGLSTADFEGEPLYVIDGNIYTGDIKDLDPGLIRGIKVLKDSEATAIYGAQAANGVVLINTGGSFLVTNSFSMAGAEYDVPFLESAGRSGSIRNNFSDYAFWQPRLTTDKNGKVSFDVKFPDDVTRWRTFYMAMSDGKQSGQAEGSVKSYKPLMAQLSVPGFLIENDNAVAIGKILNYTADTVAVRSKIEIEGDLVSEKMRDCARALVDSISITAIRKDSIAIRYYLEKDDGYFDGEERYIPVFPAGLEETEGMFVALDRDTSLNIGFRPGAGVVTIYARAGLLDVLGDEISRLIHYKYSCNEQMASKLKAILAEQRVAEFQNKMFRRGEVDRIIRLLNRSKKDDELWGWWKSSAESSLWISLHVLEALTQAREMGYKASLNESRIADMLAWEITRDIRVEEKLRALHILRRLNSKIDYSAFISHIEKSGRLSLNQLLQLMELKQMCGLSADIDTLDFFRKETMYGNVYFGDEKENKNMLTGNIQNTLTAYRILRGDTLNNHEQALRKMRNYLLENRQSGYWSNTYESSKIIETILPDLLTSGSEVGKPRLILTGAIEKEIVEFPFEASISPDDTLGVSKTGDYPVYLTAYRRYLNPAPSEKKSDFEISTEFEDAAGGILKAGKEVRLKVMIKVLKDADYVMINVPIPAGCSYVNKSGKSPYEVYRESFRNETAIFCEKLRTGDYEFFIDLMPRYAGEYTLNPARVELMYFPVFNSNNSTRKVNIR